MINIEELYSRRSIEFIKIYNSQKWKFKLYGIAYKKKSPSQNLIDLTKIIIDRNCPVSTSNNYNVGFAGIHEGKGTNFIFLDWWMNENELYRKVFISSLDKPHLFEERTATGITACVWDLEVIDHERKAWIKHVLSKKVPDLNQYLDDQMNNSKKYKT